MDLKVQFLNNTRKIALIGLIVFCSLLPQFAFSQGSGVDGDLTVNSTYVIDNVRTIPSANVSLGSTVIPFVSTTGFNAGDKFLIIQTCGTNAGTFEELEVLSVAGNLVTVCSACCQSYDHDGISEFCQIIRVPQFRNVIVTSTGVITANAWNGTSGGVIAFYVSGLLTVQSGGKIDATALGFRGGSSGAGGSGGMGDAGGAAGITGAGGKGGSSGAAGLGGAGGGILAYYGGDGGAIGNAGSLGFTGANGEGLGGGTSAINALNNSSYPSLVSFGGGGKAGNGGNGGIGAGGGGGGGKASLLTFGTTSGSAGGKGGNGGSGGNGGNGGGIIFIHVDSLSLQGSVLANGGNGSNGGNGTNGGNGGNGGKGGSTLGIGGLGGGGGGGGNGANGGDGGEPGSGGAGGLIFLEINTVLSLTGTVQADGGQPGIPGLPGNPGCGGAGGIGGDGLIADGFNGTGGGCGTGGSVVNNSRIGGKGSITIIVPDPLPIHLISFDVSLSEANVVLIEWETATEINTLKFVVERSVDGKRFYPVSEIGAAGSSNTARRYFIKDEVELPNSLVYYRLKEVDIDGKQFIFEMKPVKLNAKRDVKFSPNPSSGEFRLDLGDNSAGMITFYNSQGAAFHTEYFSEVKDLNFDLQEKGLVFYRLHIEGKNPDAGSIIIK